MEGNYRVLLNRNPVGEVTVLRQGLYYRFRCCCRFQKDSVCRLMVRIAESKENIGVLMPEGDGYTLDKQIAVKKFGQGTPEFYIAVQGEKQEDGMFVPLSPEEPFAYLSKLKDAFLSHQNGVGGVWIPKK